SRARSCAPMAGRSGSRAVPAKGLSSAWHCRCRRRPRRRRDPRVGMASYSARCIRGRILYCFVSGSTDVNVLIVDDNEAAADLLQELLVLQDHTARCTYTGPQAPGVVAA